MTSIPDSSPPETAKAPETLQGLLDRVGWLLREPLDFSSKGDQAKIREARSCVSAAHLKVMKSRIPPEEQKQ